MVAGLLRGLTHEEAVRFSFLLATPIILAAGAYKVPDLLGPLGDGIRGQSVAGAAAAFVAAFVAAKFLERWFRTRTLTRWPWCESRLPWSQHETRRAGLLRPPPTGSGRRGPSRSRPAIKARPPFPGLRDPTSSPFGSLVAP